MGFPKAFAMIEKGALNWKRKRKKIVSIFVISVPGPILCKWSSHNVIIFLGVSFETRAMLK